jgi:hypothetical protein
MTEGGDTMKTCVSLAAGALALTLGAAAWAENPVERVDPAAVQAILDRVDSLHVTSHREADESQPALPAELQAIIDDAERAEREDTEQPRIAD